MTKKQSFLVSLVKMVIPIPHRFFRGWHLILLRGRRPFRLYFVVAVIIDPHDQYIVFIRKLFQIAITSRTSKNKKNEHFSKGVVHSNKQQIGVAGHAGMLAPRG